MRGMVIHMEEAKLATLEQIKAQTSHREDLFSVSLMLLFTENNYSAISAASAIKFALS